MCCPFNDKSLIRFSYILFRFDKRTIEMFVGNFIVSILIKNKLVTFHLALFILIRLMINNQRHT